MHKTGKGKLYKPASFCYNTGQKNKEYDRKG